MRRCHYIRINEKLELLGKNVHFFVSVFLGDRCDSPFETFFLEKTRVLKSRVCGESFERCSSSFLWFMEPRIPRWIAFLWLKVKMDQLLNVIPPSQWKLQICRSFLGTPFVREGSCQKRKPVCRCYVRWRETINSVKDLKPEPNGHNLFPKIQRSAKKWFSSRGAWQDVLRVTRQLKLPAPRQRNLLGRCFF